MGTYPVDVKIKRITTAGSSQTIFAGAARCLGFSANCTAGAGTIDIEDDGSSVGVFGTPDGSKKSSRLHIGFLAQEMLREANTIASKCLDGETSKRIVEIKGAIDRIKEQVQNAE